MNFSATNTLRSMNKITFLNRNFITMFGLAAFVAVSIARIHLRAETTLIGYDLGNLKIQEGRLLEEKSLLRMEMAKLTSRSHLQLMAELEHQETNDAEDSSSFAVVH